MKRKYQFYLDEVEQAAAEKWIQEQEKALAEKQEQDIELVKRHPEIKDGMPYTGAIGGMFSFTFAPTSIGDVIRLRNTVTGETIDVTNYDCW